MKADLDELDRLYGPAVYFDADARGKIINAMPALIAELRALRVVAAAGREVAEHYGTGVETVVDVAVTDLREALAKVPK